MMKTISILCTLLPGMTSFAGQSIQRPHIEHSQIPSTCTLTVLVGNLSIKTTSDNCRQLTNIIWIQDPYINFDLPGNPDGEIFLP